MNFAPHGWVGAAVGTFIPNPLLAFAAGVVSHLILDAIPHAEPKMRAFGAESPDVSPSQKEAVAIGGLNRAGLVHDVIFIAVDGLLGIAGAALLFWEPFVANGFWNSTVMGMIGGMTPDVLLILFLLTRKEPFVSFQRLHLWAHAKTNLNHLNPILGFGSQVVICLIIAMMAKIIRG